MEETFLFFHSSTFLLFHFFLSSTQLPKLVAAGEDDAAVAGLAAVDALLPLLAYVPMVGGLHLIGGISQIELFNYQLNSLWVLRNP